MKRNVIWGNRNGSSHRCDGVLPLLVLRGAEFDCSIGSYSRVWNYVPGIVPG